MTWSPFNNETKAEFLAREAPTWKPRLVMPLRVSFAIFVCLALLIIISLLLLIAAGGA